MIAHIGSSARENRPSFVNRAARRTFCHVDELPFGRKAKSSVANSLVESDPQPHTRHPHVRVATFPSTNQNCCHQVFAEHGAQLKKLNLVSARRVEVRQRFQAEAGSQLLFDCVVLLKSGGGCGPAANVQAVVVNLKTQTAEVLLDRTTDAERSASHVRIGSNARESLSLLILAAGEYELRTITSIDPTCSGAEAHLLIDSVRVTDAFGAETWRLASLSCVGRVTQ